LLAKISEPVIRVVLAGVQYAFGCLAAGTLAGPIREALIPIIGETGSLVWEGMLLLIVIFLSSMLASRLPITLTELAAITAAAIIGESSQPKTG
jgi:hypothetical protein